MRGGVDSRRRRILAGALGTALLPGFAFAQGQRDAVKNREIYLCAGAGSDKKVLGGARKEREVVVYNSLNLKDSVPIVEVFERKYGGVKVQLWRSSSEKVLQRAIAEARAGRFSCDILGTNGPAMEAMHREQLLEEFFSPHFKDLPAYAFPTHRQYVADRFNFFTIAYNTNLVKANEVPNTYEDLLNPRFAGRVGLEASDVDWFGAMVKAMGEQKGLAFFRKLAAAKPEIRSGHTLIAELVASGEIPLAATIYNHNAERLVVKGAPIRWKALKPTFGRPNAIGVARRAPHPYAALLFADFMLSLEGQTILKERNRVPSSRAVDTHLNKFPFEMIDPVITLDEADRWEKLWSDLFLKGQKIQRETD